MKKTLILAIAAIASVIAAPAHSSDTYDVQFEANGMTYTLSSQMFPLEIYVDEWGGGTFYDIFQYLYTVAAFDHFVPSTEWLSQTGDEATLVSGPAGGFTLTISRPFAGTIDLSGEYEYTETSWEYDPDLDDYRETFVPATASYCITISVPDYVPEPDISAIVASSGDVGKVIGANGRLYLNADDAAMAGTTAEAMVAYLDMTNRMGLAIALTDAGSDVRFRLAADTVANDWAPNHRVALAEWRLPTLSDWRLIFAGCGGENPGSALTADTAYDIGSFHSLIQSAGGAAVATRVGVSRYASSTTDSSSNWCFDFSGDGSFCKVNSNRGVANVRACLAFDFVTPYDVWAEENGLGAPDAETDGVPNLVRYVFGSISGPVRPLAEISIANGKPVVKTPVPVNTDGVTISLLSSTSLEDWSQAVELNAYDVQDGAFVFTHDTADPERFYRLKVAE